MYQTLRNIFYTGLTGLVLLGPQIAEAKDAPEKCRTSRTLEGTVKTCVSKMLGKKQPSRRTLKYNAKDVLIEELQDWNSDGNVNLKIEYDAQGRKVRETEDYNDDKNVNVSEYDTQGRKIKGTSYNNGEIKSTLMYIYDTLGRDITLITDLKGDGTIDGVWTRVYKKGYSFQLNFERGTNGEIRNQHGHLLQSYDLDGRGVPIMDIFNGTNSKESE